MSDNKIIKLIVYGGSAAGTIYSEVTGNDCRALKIPRQFLNNYPHLDEFTVGVYLLFCEDDSLAPGVYSLYVGESENIPTRLNQHIADYSTDKEKFYWNTAVLFSGRDLNKSLCHFIEHSLKEHIIKNAHICLTKKTHCPTLSLIDKEHAEQFISSVEYLLCVFGLPVLSAKNPVPGATEFFCTSGGANAKGYQSVSGFIVTAGSTVSSTVTPSLAASGYGPLRDKLEKSQIISAGVFSKNYEFTSPSAAASVVSGSPANGRDYWITADGKKLKDIESV